jgi:hypothetical protein
MLARRVGDAVEVADRAADAMQAPVDEDPDGARPSGHDGFHGHAVELVLHRATSIVRGA